MNADRNIQRKLNHPEQTFAASKCDVSAKRHYLHQQLLSQAVKHSADEKKRADGERNPRDPLTFTAAICLRIAAPSLYTQQT